MSKESKPRDLWNQLGTSRYRDFCPGCGYYRHANGEHRADCTATDAIREVTTL